MDILIITVYIIMVVALISLVFLWKKYWHVEYIVIQNTEELDELRSYNNYLKNQLSHRDRVLEDFERRTREIIEYNNKLKETIEDIYQKQKEYKNA